MPPSEQQSGVVARSDRDETPEIRYVPGAPNEYWFDHDVIVLDERLKEYPNAHDHILEHELRHADPDGQPLLEFLKQELYTDLNYYFNDDEVIEEVRRYYAECDDKTRFADQLKINVVNTLRGVWMLFLRPAGRLLGEA